MVGSITDISDLSVVDVIGVFAPRICVKNNANSGDVGFKGVLEKIVPNLFV